MILTILNLIIVSTLLWVPLFFYGRKTKRMIDFYFRMGCSPNFRKLFGYVLAFMVLVFHATYPGIVKGDFGTFVSSAFAFSLICPRWTVGLLEGIRGSRFVVAFLAVMAVAMLMAPGMYSLGITLCFVLVASIFYPSPKMAEYIDGSPYHQSFDEMARDVVKHYFA
ncbi:MAG: hypothetical protein Q4B58_06240 [Bacteroidales bacterium]|nr:hypothetical protein [Bacteroidales bacterium]